VYCFDPQRYERRATGPENPDDWISVARFVIDPRLLETWKARLARLQFRGSALIDVIERGSQDRVTPKRTVLKNRQRAAGCEHVARLRVANFGGDPMPGLC
jgi:hypothetical protein